MYIYDNYIWKSSINYAKIFQLSNDFLGLHNFSAIIQPIFVAPGKWHYILFDISIF